MGLLLNTTKQTDRSASDLIPSACVPHGSLHVPLAMNGRFSGPVAGRPPHSSALHSVFSTPSNRCSPAEHHPYPLPPAGIKYTSATTPSSPVSGAFRLSSFSALPAYTKPVFKLTPSLPSLHAPSQGQYIPMCKVCVDAPISYSPLFSSIGCR